MLFLLGPIVASLLISMTNWNMISSAQWVGFDNYREMFFEDRNFWQSIRVTSYYTLLSVPIYLVAGLALSLLLNLRLRGMYTFRTILYLPAVLARWRSR